MAAGREFTLCRKGRGLAASRRPFGDARLPLRHSVAGAEVPPCHRTTQLNNEVSTLSGDLTPLSNSNSKLQLSNSNTQTPNKNVPQWILIFRLW
jgi:hypothetical protein